MRVERRAAGTTGRESFVSIHTRPTVTRDPLPELYRDVRDVYKILILFKRIRTGKGLKTNWDNRASRRRVTDYGEKRKRLSRQNWAVKLAKSHDCELSF